MVAWARSVSWGSNEAVSLLYLVLWQNFRTYSVQTHDSKLPHSHHWQYSSFTQQITRCLIYCSSGLWAFCQVVPLLTYDVATKIPGCLELAPQHIIHILGFITPKFLPICVMIVAALAIFEVAIGWTQPLVKMSTSNIPGGKGGWCVRLTTSPPLHAECHGIWEPKPPVTLCTTPGLLWENFTF
jgi:hypothetical protein